MSDDTTKPLNYRHRTLHYLPQNKNKLQDKFNEVENFCKIQRNVINSDKTKTVIFNTAQSKDFTPRIRNSLGTEYENVENFKLLGVEFVTDARKGLSFDTYINKCIKKGYS